MYMPTQRLQRTHLAAIRAAGLCKRIDYLTLNPITERSLEGSEFGMWYGNANARRGCIDYPTPRLAVIACAVCGPVLGPLCAVISLTLRRAACNI